MPENAYAYEVLLAEAVRIGWPRYFLGDLMKIDRFRLLSEDAPAEFCWSLRQAGTFLYRGEQGDLWQALFWQTRCTPETYSHYYHFNRCRQLFEHTFPEFLQVVERIERAHNNGRVLDCGHDGYPRYRDSRLLTMLEDAFGKNLRREQYEEDIQPRRHR